MERAGHLKAAGQAIPDWESGERIEGSLEELEMKYKELCNAASGEIQLIHLKMEQAKTDGLTAVRKLEKNFKTLDISLYENLPYDEEERDRLAVLSEAAEKEWKEYTKKLHKAIEDKKEAEVNLNNTKQLISKWHKEHQSVEEGPLLKVNIKRNYENRIKEIRKQQQENKALILQKNGAVSQYESIQKSITKVIYVDNFSLSHIRAVSGDLEEEVKRLRNSLSESKDTNKKIQKNLQS